MQYNSNLLPAQAMHPARLLLTPLAVLVGIGSSARADDQGPDNRGGGSAIILGAFAGGHAFAEGSGLGVSGGEQNVNGARDSVLGGVRASVGLGRWLVAEAELAGLATQDRIHRQRARILGYRINALAPLRSGDFRPFVLLGAGAMQVASSDGQGSEGLAPDTQAEVHTGLGFDYRVLGCVSVRGDARVLQVPGKTSWGLATDVEATLGASVAFEVGASSPRAESEPTVAVAVTESRPSRMVAAEELPPPIRFEKTSADSAKVADLTTVPAGDTTSEPAPSGQVVAVVSARPVSDILGRAREIKFAAGTTRLTEPSLAFLDEVAAALSQEPDARLEIVAHTADGGDAKKDLALSRRRAEAIKYALVGKGASVDQLVATGRGSEDPIAPNLTRTGRMRNERVELHRVSATVPRP